jgi:hypothetical protein
MSLPQSLGRGGVKLRVRVVARNPCPEHGYAHSEEFNPDGSRVDPLWECSQGIIGVSEGPDIAVNALAQLIQVNILALAAQTIKTVANSAQAISVGDVASAPVVVAGVTSTTPAFTDFALGDGTTNTDYHTTGSYCHAGAVQAISSNTFQVTGTIACAVGGGVTYKEVGLAVTITHAASPFYFLLAHDLVNSGTGYLVSNGGSLAVTYTGTFT